MTPTAAYSRRSRARFSTAHTPGALVSSRSVSDAKSPAAAAAAAKKKKKKKKALPLTTEDKVIQSILRDVCEKEERVVRLILQYHLALKRVCVLPPLNTIDRREEFEHALMEVVTQSKKRDLSDLTVTYPLSWDGSVGFPPGATLENADYYFSVRVAYWYLLLSPLFFDHFL